MTLDIGHWTLDEDMNKEISLNGIKAPKVAKSLLVHGNVKSSFWQKQNVYYSQVWRSVTPKKHYFSDPIEK